ncbi:MAG TPA: NAD(P)H-binding protein [Flavisolibacter sp.]|nr:NAD(P)H-binding protein [Flavisolibacter sp.]
MNYVITGGAGNISKPIVEQLLAAGHQVTVIGRSEKNLQSLIAAGARSAIGSVEDPSFLTEAFKGADAVYTMVPPNWAATDWKAYMEQVGKNYAAAIKANGIKYVVNLSSIGAHLPEGCGPVSGLYREEQVLNSLEGVAIKHLRPGFFFANFFGNISMIRSMGLLGSNFGDQGSSIVLSHTGDIADAAVAFLQQLDFTGHSVAYLSSDERSLGEVAQVLGQAIGNPNLPWVLFTDEQSLEGMLQSGLPEEFARNYVEMGAAMRNGIMTSDYRKSGPDVIGKTKLEDFARIFAAVYASEKTEAVS